MSFLYPEFLYYMLPPLFVLFGFILTQQESQADFFSKEVMDKLRVTSNAMTLQARNALFLFAAFLMIIALANPVINEGEIDIKAKSSDIMIALDISDSMLAEDVYPNRLKLAKQKAIEFLKLGSDERVGVVAFAKNSYLVSPLSFDHDAVRFLLSSLSTNSLTQKGTNFMTLLDVVANSSQDKEKHLLIISDGGDSEDFSKEIAYAKENDITVFVLGLGSKKGAPIKLENGEFIKQNGDIIISKLNDSISTLATSTGGVYIEGVNSNEDIKAMLREIKAKTKAKELKSQKVQKYIPLFYYPLGVALFILLIATSSMSKRVSVNVPSLFLIGLLVFGGSDAKAGLLDFMSLQDAKEAYENKQYEKSAKLYEQYAKETQNAQSFFNAANSYYKNGDYDKAIDNYLSSTPESNEFIAKKYANLGNSYAKRAKEDDLQNALKSYEKSLKYKDDKDVRENYEAVKKALEDKEEQKNEQQDNKENQDKNQKENQDNQQNGDEQSKDDKQNQDVNESQDKNNKQNKDKQDKDGDAKDDKKEQDANGKDKLDENQTDDKNIQQQESEDSSIDESQMSEAEVKKWIEQLNKEANTYMYRLNTDNRYEENENEKPW